MLVGQQVIRIWVVLYILLSSIFCQDTIWGGNKAKEQEGSGLVINTTLRPRERAEGLVTSQTTRITWKHFGRVRAETHITTEDCTQKKDEMIPIPSLAYIVNLS